MAPRKNIAVARAGNYAAPVDTSGMDESMKATLAPKTQKLDKTESAYVAGAQNKDTAKIAVSRARKANKQAPPPEE